MSKQSFRELGVSPPVVAVLAAKAIDHPFRIQGWTALAVLAQASGSGSAPEPASLLASVWGLSRMHGQIQAQM